jgi:flagellar motor switch protein FliG
VALTGKQKAALLLATLDVATATELLKGMDPGTVHELAVELSYLDAAGHRNAEQTADVTRQFCQSLQDESGFHFKNFVREMLKNTVGEDKTKQIQHEVQDLLERRDPFIAIRSADLETLAAVLETDHPQAVAVVLSELPPKKSSAILGLLGDGMRVSAISRMTSIGAITPEAKTRIAQMIRKRIEEMGTARQSGTVAQVRPEESLRKVAVIVRNLEREVRDGVLEAIRQKDGEACEKVTNLMVLWDDVPLVADRTLQQALRGVDERQLALALHEASEKIVGKIRSNISERAASLVDEEASLMSAPKKEDVQKAREKIVNVLREMNTAGELNFVEESP